MSAYLTLFIISFLAATFLPAYSEIMFAGYLATGYSPLLLWIWATTGNTLGSCLNWVLGRYLLQFKSHQLFPFREENLERSQRWFQRYGVWSLLLAWAPVGGDALTFIAGIMRVRFGIFILLTGIGKGTRYAILMVLLSWF